MMDFHGEWGESWRYQTNDHGILARVGRGEFGGVAADIIHGM
jgi:hypothetical protein